MLTLTSSAAAQIKSFVQSSGISGGAVRLFLTGGGCCGPGFALDVVPSHEATDVAVVHGGATLYIQQEAVGLLDGVVVDFQDSFLLRGLKSSGCCG